MNAELFTKMVNRWNKAITNYAYRLIYDKSLADDIVQDMWMGLWRQKVDVDIDRAYGLLALTLRRRYIDHCRTHDLKLQFDIAGGLLPYSEPVDIGTYSVSLKKTLAQLSPKIRQSVEAVVIKGFTHQETADKFGVSINTVLSRVRRGKEQLRRIK